MIQIGHSYQDGNGNCITIDGRVKSSPGIEYFYSTEHAYYNDKGEFILKKEWETSPENKLNLDI